MLADAGGVLPRKAMLERHRASRACRPPGAAPAQGSPRPARRIPAAAAQARRPALARGVARGPQQSVDAAPCRRPGPRPCRRGRCARRGAGLPPARPRVAAHRPCRPPRQPCPQGAFGGRRRSGRCRAGDVGRPRRRGPRTVDGGSRLHPGRRRVALARPPRRRATDRRAPHPTPLPSWPSSKRTQGR